MSEKRAFKMHPQLLFDVIQRQAGTLGKAVLEGVMNAVDAGAGKININITENSVEISDDGKGFRNRNEVELFFETFGQPHEANENKRYGCFRMGRGQMFAFGKNHWRTGEFSMEVDIKNDGLDYTLKDDLVAAPGCKILIDLYTKLGSYDQRTIGDEVKKAVKWVDVKIYLNDELISKVPADAEWDEEDENAWYKFRETGDVQVYNLGVQVRSYGSYSFGCGGEIVSKKQLKLNFARNDVMSECPIWKAIRKVINEQADQKIRKKKSSLNEAARSRIAAQIIDGEISPEDAMDMPILTDVNGRNWSIKKLAAKGLDYRNVFTNAPRSDNKGCRLMDHKLAFVLADEALERFNFENAEPLLKLITENVCPWFPLKYRCFHALTKDLNASYKLISPSEYTPLERATLHCIERGQGFLVADLSDARLTRKVVLGKAGCADGWTDGVNYVAINREFLREVGVNHSGWIKIGQLMLHEYCHDEPDTVTHYHSPEFYEMYHNSGDALVEFVEKAISYFPQCLNSQNRMLTRKQLLEQDQEKRRVELADSLAAKQED